MDRALYFIILAPIIVNGATGDDVVIGILGSSVSIECTLPLSDTLVWEDSNGNIIGMKGIVSGHVTRKYVIEKQNGVREILVIHALTLEDEKRYRCYDLMNNTDVEVSKVTVLVEPPVMKVTSPRGHVLEGTEVTLVCEADGGKPLPEIKWHKIDSTGATSDVIGTVSDVIYSNNTGYRRHIISFNVTRDTCMTSYVCNLAVSVFYQRSLKVDLDVQLKPRQPVITGYQGGYDVNKVMTLECTSTGSTPTATIFWLIDNVAVGDYEFVVIPEGFGTFTVKSFFKRTMSLDFNASVLTCAVTNIVLEKQGLSPRMTNLTLLASYKPIISIPIRKLTSSEGGDVTLKCVIDALPSPDPDTLVWRHNWREVSRDLYVMPNGTNVFRLRLSNLSRLDAGQYSCAAANRLGVTTSDSLSLTVLYAPVCISSSVVKQAARLGDSVRLRCHVQALPSNVTLLWRYQHSNTLIDTFPAIKDGNIGDLAHGILDFKLKSRSQYTKIACFGFNAIGQGQAPCVYEIVPPSAPEPPFNCSAISDGSDVNVKCEPGFNGGSKQQFMLQQVLKGGYQPVKNSSLPAFTLSSLSNVTVRMCVVNEEFGHVASCSAPLRVTLRVSGTPRKEPVTVRKINSTAYIAGGVTAFVGLIVVTASVTVLVRRQRKQCRKSDIPTSLEQCVRNSQKQEKQSKAKLSAKSIWQSIKTVGTLGDKTRPAAKTVRRCEVVTNVDDSDDDVTYQRIEVIASTPFGMLKQHGKLETLNIGTPSVFPGDVQPKVESNDVLNNFRSSSGFTLSPISIHSETSVGILDKDEDIQRSREDHTDAVIGDAYCTADIMDILGDTKELDIQCRLEFTADVEETMSAGLVTRNKDYSAGDILEVLSDFEAHGNVNTHQDVSEMYTTFQDSLSEVTVQTCREKSFTDISKLNFLENESHVNDAISITIVNRSITGNIESNRLLQSDARPKRCNSLNKVYSLPYRSKQKKLNALARMNSVPGTQTCSPEELFKTQTLVSGLHDTLVYASQRGSNVSVNTCVSTTDDQELEATSIKKGANSPHPFFADVNDTLFDIDKYTLTVTSEIALDCCVDDPSNDSVIETGEHDSCRVSVEQGCGQTREQSSDKSNQNCLRSNSFLSAIKNNRFDSMSGTTVLPLDSETPDSYVNECFDLEDGVDTVNVGCNMEEQKSNNSANINVMAYF